MYHHNVSWILNGKRYITHKHVRRTSGEKWFISDNSWGVSFDRTPLRPRYSIQLSGEGHGGQLSGGPFLCLGADRRQSHGGHGRGLVVLRAIDD